VRGGREEGEEEVGSWEAARTGGVAGVCVEVDVVGVGVDRGIGVDEGVGVVGMFVEGVLGESVEEKDEVNFAF
jgi:hypothetical protein